MEKKEPVRRLVVYTLLPIFIVLLLFYDYNHQGSFSSSYSGEFVFPFLRRNSKFYTKSGSIVGSFSVINSLILVQSIWTMEGSRVLGVGRKKMGLFPWKRQSQVSCI